MNPLYFYVHSQCVDLMDNWSTRLWAKIGFWRVWLVGWSGLRIKLRESISFYISWKLNILHFAISFQKLYNIFVLIRILLTFW